jgi:hypothetical protein
MDRSRPERDEKGVVMSDVETQVTTMLHERAAVAQPMHRLDAVLDDVTEIRVVTPHRRRDWRPLLAAAAALVLVVGGLVALTHRSADSPVAEPGTSGPKFSFITQQVSLTADDFWIEVGGKRFTSVGAKVELNTDPGDATYQTLELVWTEHDVEMRVNIYFQAAGKQWSSDELRTYNGNAQGDWVTFTGDFFRSPLGSPFTGDFDQTATEKGVTSHMHLAGMRLQAFLDRGPGGVTVPTSSTLPKLTMSELSIPPLPSGLPATGRALKPEAELAQVMAEQLAIADCMVAKGWQFPLLTPKEWATAMGAWQPDEVLGIVGIAGAREFGYHDSQAKGGDALTAYSQGLSPSDLQRFQRDQDGGGSEMKSITTSPDGSPSEQRITGGCFGEMVAQFGEAYDRQEVIRQKIEPVRENSRIAAGTDLAVISALTRWSVCVQNVVGETASTPNELARRYAFVQGVATDHEKQVAVADAECQKQVDLWTVYYTSVAHAERALMGADAGLYDELTQLHQQMVEISYGILKRHNIGPSSLD